MGWIKCEVGMNWIRRKKVLSITANYDGRETPYFFYMSTGKIIHEGRNIKRIREMLGIKQDALAMDLGEDWNQKKISLLEQKESIEPEILEEVAKALKVPADAIKQFDEETAIFNIQHNYEGSTMNSLFHNYQCSFNPLEKVMELYEDRMALYERMLKDKEDMVQELRSLLHKN